MGYSPVSGVLIGKVTTVLGRGLNNINRHIFPDGIKSIQYANEPPAPIGQA